MQFGSQSLIKQSVVVLIWSRIGSSSWVSFVVLPTSLSSLEVMKLRSMREGSVESTPSVLDSKEWLATSQFAVYHLAVVYSRSDRCAGGKACCTHLLYLHNAHMNKTFHDVGQRQSHIRLLFEATTVEFVRCLFPSLTPGPDHFLVDTISRPGMTLEFFRSVT